MTDILTESTSRYQTLSRELFSENNVPSVTFIAPEESSPKCITLVCVSIFVTTVEIDTDTSFQTLNVKLLDT